MSLETIAIVAVVGVVVGWLAGLVMDGRGYGPGVDIVLGVVGGIVGSATMRMAGTVPAGISLEMASAALLGAVVLVFAQRMCSTASRTSTG